MRLHIHEPHMIEHAGLGGSAHLHGLLRDGRERVLKAISRGNEIRNAIHPHHARLAGSSVLLGGSLGMGAADYALAAMNRQSLGSIMGFVVLAYAGIAALVLGVGGIVRVRRQRRYHLYIE